jgi:hypothetical protein
VPRPVSYAPNVDDVDYVTAADINLIQTDITEIDTDLATLESSFASHVHDGADITTGTIDPARHGTGTRDGTKFLRDDGAWTVPTGSGDVTGAASSVDSEIVLYSGTTGKVLKRASGSGIAKITNGVLGVGTPGTDYAAASHNHASSEIASGTLDTARLPFTGTTNGSKFLRDDFTWADPPGGGGGSGEPTVLYPTLTVQVSEPSSGAKSANLTAINAAITSAATVGGRVQLPVGTIWINGPILMRSYVHLAGQGENVTIIKMGGAADQSGFHQVNHSILTPQSFMVFSDFTYDGNKSNQSIGPTNNSDVTARAINNYLGFEMWGMTDSIIERVTVRNTTKTGFYFVGSRNIIRHCHGYILGRLASDSATYEFMSRIGRSGVVADTFNNSLDAGRSHDCKIHDNILDDVEEHGIKIYPDSDSCDVIHNTIRTARVYGIYNQDNRKTNIHGNRMVACLGFAIYNGGLSQSYNVRVTDNMAEDIAADMWGDREAYRNSQQTNGFFFNNSATNSGSIGLSLSNTNLRSGNNYHD